MSPDPIITVLSFFAVLASRIENLRVGFESLRASAANSRTEYQSNDKKWKEEAERQKGGKGVNLTVKIINCHFCGEQDKKK